MVGRITGSSKSEAQKLTGVRKRQQIEVANKTMFISIVIAAIALSFTVASAQYLFSKWQHNNRIIGAKYKAIGTLNSNITNAQSLKQAVDSLVANQDLASVKTNKNDPNTKSILDALPAKFEPAALATSLQQSILRNSSVTIESITVPPESGEEVATDSTPQEMRSSFVVTGSYSQIKQMVLDLERTIRPMKIDTISLEGSGSSIRATFEVTTYYQPVRSNLVKEESIK